MKPAGEIDAQSKQITVLVVVREGGLDSPTEPPEYRCATFRTAQRGPTKSSRGTLTKQNEMAAPDGDDHFVVVREGVSGVRT